MPRPRFSLANLSIKQRLPLLIGALLLGVIVASTWAAYRGVKESALEVGRERLLNLTQQLASLSQQSAINLTNKTFTAANDPAIKTFLSSPSASTRPGAAAILQQFAAPRDPNSSQVELWDAKHSLALVWPEGSSPQATDLRFEFDQSNAEPPRAVGTIRILKDAAAYPVVATVKGDEGKPIGYLVRWRRLAATPEARKQLTDLLGSHATLYFGNLKGDVWTDMVNVVPKPPGGLASTLQVTHYVREGNSVMTLGRPVSGTPWFITVEFPDDVFLSQARKFLRRMVVSGLVLLGFGVTGAIALSHNITRPLHSLTNATSAIIGGDYSRAVDVRRHDELGELAVAFNSMVLKTRDAQGELELKVRALRESEHRLQTVIENLSEGLVVSDLDGQLLHWNRAALEIHGFDSLDECLLKLPELTSIFELSDLDGSVLDIEQWPLPRIIRGESLRNLEVRIRRLEANWSRVFNYGGAIVREMDGRSVAVVTMSDITERKLAEQEIQRLNEELEQRVADRTAQLQATNKELEAFSYSVSHDLRAPLRHVASYSQMLQKNSGPRLDESGTRYLEVIQEAAGRMADLIDNLLAFSHLGRTDLKKIKVDPNQLVQTVIADLEDETIGRKIQWSIGEIPRVNADSALLQMVFTNLLSNALKFTRNRLQSEIEVGCSRNNGEVIVFVRDNGAGFDMKYADKLFGVFQRLHRADEFEGTGIGLANVQRIILRHGGKTWAESRNGDGATFYFSLPLTEERIQV